MESPYVAAWDNSAGSQIAYAHRRCVTPPRFLVHLSLNRAFDYGKRRCGICNELLMETAQEGAVAGSPPASRPPRPAEQNRRAPQPAVRKPLAAATRPRLPADNDREGSAAAAAQVMFVIKYGSGYHVHAVCFLRSPDRALFRVVRSFTNCGPIICHFCRQAHALSQSG